MSRWVALALAGGLSLAGALTGCSGDDDDAGAGGSPEPSASARVFTAAEARAALLTENDLPTGLTKDPAYAPEDLPGGCAAVDAAIKAERALSPTEVGVSFAKDESEYSVESDISLYPSAAEAAAVFDSYEKAFADCPTWQTSEGGETATITITKDSEPTIRDQAAVYTIGAEFRGSKIGGQQYVVQRGNAIVFVSESGVAAEQDDPEVDPAALVRIVVERLANGA